VFILLVVVVVELTLLQDQVHLLVELVVVDQVAH
jgi:hypothetical protein